MLESMKRTLALLVALTTGTLMIGCDDNSLQPPTATDPPLLQLSGQVTSGQGTGTLKTLIGESNGLPLTGTIQSNGHFKVQLPTETTLSKHLLSGQHILESVGCKGAINSSNAATKGIGFVSFQFKRGQIADTLINGTASFNLFPLPHGNFRAHIYLFSSHATTLSGKVNCADVINVKEIDTIQVYVNSPLRAGWNVLYLDVNTSNLQLPLAAEGSLQTVRPKHNIWLTSQQIREEFPF